MHWPYCEGVSGLHPASAQQQANGKSPLQSKEGTRFRIWANKILKDYMLKGYAVNQKRLEYLEKTIKLIDIANRVDERLENNDAKEILKVI